MNQYIYFILGILLGLAIAVYFFLSREEKIEKIMEQEKPNQKEQIKLKYDNLKDYFPKGYNLEQMKNVIEKLLKNYQLKWQKDRNDSMR